jgi:hypothetical protein
MRSAEHFVVVPYVLTIRVVSLEVEWRGRVFYGIDVFDCLIKRTFLDEDEICKIDLNSISDGRSYLGDIFNNKVLKAI